MPGMATEIVGVTVNEPMPVLAVELKNLTAVGAVEAAGTVTGGVTELVGVVQVEPPAQAADAPVSEDAVVARV